MILLNEFDLAYNGQNFDAAGTASRVDQFRTNYLATAQASDTAAVDYPHYYIGGTNTGLHSGFDLRNDGNVDNTPGDQGYGDDAYGFGQFPGKYGFILLSKCPDRCGERAHLSVIPLDGYAQRAPAPGSEGHRWK